MKDEMAKLKEAEKKNSDVEFLTFVYKTWPPKRKDFTMEDPKKIVSHDERKKALQVGHVAKY